MIGKKYRRIISTIPICPYVNSPIVFLLALQHKEFLSIVLLDFIKVKINKNFLLF